MKKLLIILLLFLINENIFSKEVPVIMAEKVAKNLFYERNNFSPLMKYNNIIIDTTYSIKHDSTLVYYVFNFKNNEGYVIVSADDKVNPVLAYSFEGNYTGKNLPPQFTAWMENYKQMILQAVKINLPADASIKAQWTKYSSPSILKRGGTKGTVAPLLSTRWGQGCYYNTLCPSDNKAPNGYCSHVPTGCVATAMAQLMRYWYYPIHGNGSFSYTSSYGVLSADFGSTTFDWTNMPVALFSASKSEQKKAVSTLMYALGVSVKMNYKSSGSGSFTPDMVSSFTNYFSYSPDISFVRFEDYNFNGWTNLIRSQLDANKPIIYGGFDPSYGGHAFICDGYQANNFFHFDWGWDGYNNGYFSLNNLSPDNNNNFTLNQNAVINIYPDVKIQGPVNVCSYQTGIQYEVSYSNAYDIQWTVEGGEITSGQGTEKIEVNWTDSLTGKISVKIYFDKLFSNNKYVTKSETISIISRPKPSKIKLKDDNVLVCSDTTVDEYQWYYKGVPIKDEIKQFYVAPLPFDKTGPYWVLTSFKNGCGTKSQLYSDTLNNDKITNNNDSIFLYNISGDASSLRINVSSIITGNFKINAYDAIGRKIKEFNFYKSYYDFNIPLNMTDIEHSLVFIEILLNNKRVVRKTILMN